MTTSPLYSRTTGADRCLVRPTLLDRRRRGFTLIEMIVATILFAALLSTFVPLMKAIAKTQRGTERQRIALREANDLLVQITQRSWADLTVDSLNKLTLPDAAKSVLPQAMLDFDVAEIAEPIVSKQVSVRIR